ncbi:GntR family transcriptional regulator [Pseudomonas sp. nanlin1]|uniref:GntR family transcriptional regulator n=1 Tax=Pseudomonas sp. nanlin1 TaxID=3040605 RepID=UPI00388F0F90
MGPNTPQDADGIAEQITAAIMEHRLPPGIKLAEEKLAVAFGVGRNKIRQALMALAKQGLVKLHPNRGAFVTSPGVQEARDLFATRRLLEPEIIRNVINRSTKAQRKPLHAHLKKEALARKNNDRRAVIKLSGDFHILLAEIGANSFISRIMRQLCPFTSLIHALYDGPQTLACPEDEHGAIVQAIEDRDEARAIALMLHHLEHVENALNLSLDQQPAIQWETVFN